MKREEINLGRELSLLSFFARSLSHQIRGHLSVISNDLQYFASLLPKGECERSIARSKEISKVFDFSTALLREKFKYEEFHLLKLVNESFGQLVNVDPNTPDSIIVGDFELLKKAFHLISELLVDLYKREQNIKVSFDENQSLLLIESPIINKEISEESRAQKWRSFSHFFSNLIDSDSIVPPIIDAVLWGHSFETKITQRDCLRIEIFFALEK